MDPLVYVEAGYGTRSRVDNGSRTPRYVKLALAVLALLGVLLGAAFTTSAGAGVVDTPNGGGHRRALLEAEGGAALDIGGLDARFDAFLDARLANLAEQSCVKIPDPEIRRHVIAFDPPQPKNARSLPTLTVVEGDTLVFRNTDQNNYENPKQQQPWLADVWQTTSVEDYDACAINVDGKPTEHTYRLWYSNEVHDGKAVYQVQPAAEAATLYFTTANGWKRMDKWGWCTHGLKLTVNVLPRPTVVKCDGSLANLFLGQQTNENVPNGAAVGVVAAATAAAVEEIEMAATQQAALVDDLSAVVTKLSDKVGRRSTTIAVLSQQLMLAQQATEHRVRAEGSSGIVDVRGFKGGIDAYSDSSFVGRGVGAIHNHGNFMDTMGMGEVEVVLNGVMFKTRHNDYRLQTPSYTSGEYGAVDPITFPDVPQRVLDQPTVADEVAEMQKWFKAWKAQDATAAANDDGVARDYTQYFRPALCYLEGAWITDDDALLSTRDPDSDRHELEASNMFDLHNKTAYMANSGRKNTRENLAFVPSAVRRMVLDDEGEDAIPEVANFESRIACQLLEGDVPTGRFRVAQDLHVQLNGRPLTRAELASTRRARYELHTNPSETAAGERFEGWDDTADVHQRREYEYLDVLMEQVAGKDNNVSPALFDDLEGNRAMHRTRDEELDVSRYSRFYQLRQKDAMGFQSRRRGFADRYMWAARTTQEKVSPVAASFGKSKHNDKAKEVSEQRWTYAIPIEVVYLTPLTKWNPYNLVNHTPEHLQRHGGDKAKRIAAEAPVTAGGVDRDGAAKPRNGKCAMGDGMALNGVKRSLFYRTPVEFFESGQAMTPDPADTSGSGKAMCVLDPDGVVRRVAASGHHVFIPSVGGGVGSLRQRYPIMPLHVDGSTGYKETKALAALTLGLPDNHDHDHDHVGHHGNYEHARGGVFGESRDEAFGFDLVLSGGDHDHTVTITAAKLKLLEEREAAYRAAGSTGKVPKVVVPTEERNAHQHIVAVSRRPSESGDGGYVYTLEGCKQGGLRQGGTEDAGAANDWGFECADGHNALARSVALTATLKRLNR